MINESAIHPIINTLPVFLEVARTASFTKASINLGISQPSVSRSILMLEKYLGATLFNRSKIKLNLTLEGHKLYLATANGFKYIESKLDDIKPKIVGSKIRIGCPMILMPWLAYKVPLLRGLLEVTKVELVPMSEQDISNSWVDISIRFGSGQWDGFHSELLMKEEVFPACSPALEKKFNWLSKRLTASDLVKSPLLPVSRKESNYMGWNDWFLNFGINFCLNCQYDDFAYSYLLNIESAILENGIVLARKGTIESHLDSGKLIELPGLRVEGNNAYYLVFRADSWFSDVLKEWTIVMNKAD